jgi:hypothetical protein
MNGLTVKSPNERFYKLIFLFLSLGLLNAFLFYLLGGFNTPFPITHDNAFLGLPTRFLISISLRSGIFPMWDPYIGAGVPLNTVYTAIGLSPIVWLLSLLRKYDIVLFILEILVLNLLAFAGMWLWLKTKSSWLISLLGALSYSLSPYMLLQSKINLEAIGSAAAIPWICLGAYQISKQNSIGIAFLAGGLGLAFTSGYLGMNVLMLELLMIWAGFLVCCKYLSSSSPQRLSLRKIKNIGLYLLASATLFLLVMCIPISETFTNLTVDFFTKRAIDPFTASIQLDSLANLFDNQVSTFVSDSFGGHEIMLYLPSILLGGLIYALYKPSPFIIATLLAFTLTFTACLSKEYAVTRFLVSVLPGFKEIRFHGWLCILLIFFLITLSSMGLANFAKVSKKQAKIIATLLLTSLITFLTYASQKQLDWQYLLMIAITSIASLGAFQKIQSSSKIIGVALSICIAILTLTQLYQANIRWDIEGFKVRFDVQKLEVLQKQREDIKNASPYFPKPSNTRDFVSEFPYSGYEHYSKKPAIEGYLPQRNPAISKIINEGHIEILKHYLISPAGIPIEYEVISLSPNELKIKSLQDLTNQSTTITVPYSPNWKAYDENDQPIVIYKNHLGLMEIAPSASNRIISIQYKPTWINLMIALTLLSWVFILIWPIYQTLKTKAR